MPYSSYLLDVFIRNPKLKRERKIKEKKASERLIELNKALKKIDGMNPRWEIDQNSLRCVTPNQIKILISYSVDYSRIEVYDIRNSLSMFAESYSTYREEQVCCNRLKTYIENITKPIIEAKERDERKKKEKLEAREKAARNKFLNG